MPGQNSNNQRVTNAVLSVKLDHVIEGMDEIKVNQREQGEKIQANTVACREHATRWAQHDTEHSSLRAKSWAGDISAAIAGAVAGVAAAIAKS
jgi:hypothetical protein